jgi:hypothetical protein
VFHVVLIISCYIEANVKKCKRIYEINSGASNISLFKIISVTVFMKFNKNYYSFSIYMVFHSLQFQFSCRIP